MGVAVLSEEMWAHAVTRAAAVTRT
jgi:hypothetical protein